MKYLSIHYFIHFVFILIAFEAVMHCTRLTDKEAHLVIPFEFWKTLCRHYNNAIPDSKRVAHLFVHLLA